MRARLALLSAFLVFVAACGGGTGSSSTSGAATTGATTTTTAATTTTTEPGFEVVSEDGDLTVEVPFDAMATDPGITIRVLAPEEYPPELAGSADNPDARIYELEPEGLEFAAPVTVTRRIDAERFGGIGPSEIPMVVLITRTPDGVYEPYGDLRVVRNGADVFVSGTTTHFSPAIAVNLQQSVALELDDYHLGYATELGTKLDVGYRYYDADRTELTPPGIFEPVGFTRGNVFSFDTTTPRLGVMCDKIGTGMPRIGVNITLDATAPSTQVGLRLALLPTISLLELALKYAPDASCLDPITSFLGLLLIGLAVATDHPGGIAWVPGADFRGGASASYLTFTDQPRLDGVWGGLIWDTNNNGAIDREDSMFQPWAMEEAADVYSYVAPLFFFGNYFIYLVDGAQYSAQPEGGWTVGAGLDVFRASYTGSGRFEASIGYLATGGFPFVYEVGPGEEQVTPQDPEIAPFTRMQFQF